MLHFCTCVCRSYNKVLQGKMWVFTVRGWREADKSGIKEHFKAKEVTSQQPVKDLKYQDTPVVDVYCYMFIYKQMT